MNKYQKTITQIVKDDLKKPMIRGMFPDLSFREARNNYRELFKREPIEKIQDFRNFNRRCIV